MLCLQRSVDMQQIGAWLSRVLTALKQRLIVLRPDCSLPKLTLFLSKQLQAVEVSHMDPFSPSSIL